VNTPTASTIPTHSPTPAVAALPADVPASGPDNAPEWPFGTRRGPQGAEGHPTPKPLAGGCRRLVNGVCRLGTPGPCEFGGKGSGCCSWYAIELPVKVEVEREVEATGEAAKSTPATGGRTCRCGAPLPPRRKLCDGCAVEARRKTMRESQARWRRSTVATRNAREDAPTASGEATGATDSGRVGT